MIMINYSTAPNMKNFTHGFFNRKGGVSKDIYNSLNCGKSSNDSKENIIKNRKIVSESLNFNYEKLLIANQFHSNKVEIVREFKSSLKCDAIISLSNKIILGVLTADCCPILVAHKNRYISAVIHLGWKGLFNGILENFCYQINTLAINIDDLIFALGPCIGLESYEVDTCFKKNFIKKDEKSNKFFINIENKIFFDLRNYTKLKLINLGFTDIWCSSEDTYKNNNDFFSYRFSVHNKFKDYGRMLSIIKS
ncbi:MAG: hypothetical protein CBC22_06800 [Alphaproteobacteria bacterium TMED62]|nr:MAG: hypothetical protein CBC22_06800 [Alphaproteobacteria bacterium TMED62]|tara:strand:+ start:7150 stop:7902 length:753 start_codon:yes stop_codon:yes gene_type:complete